MRKSSSDVSYILFAYSFSTAMQSTDTIEPSTSLTSTQAVSILNLQEIMLLIISKKTPFICLKKLGKVRSGIVDI